MNRLSTNIIPSDGPLTAQLCGIGEAPGKEENFKLRPFVGSAGQLLNQCLRTVGIARSEILLHNVFVQQPPYNNINYYFQDKSNTKPTWEGQEHIDNLKKWLSSLLELRNAGGGGPNVLVAFGAVPMFILTGKRRISKWRGSVLPCTLVEGFKVYPTFHPSYVQRLMNEPEERLLGAKKKQQQNALPLFLKDLERAIIQSQSPNYERPERTFYITNELQDAIERIQALHSHDLIAVDIETLRSSTGPIVWCIGFSSSPDCAFCVPIISSMRPHWTLKQEAKVFYEISELFLNNSVNKVFQGGLYDLSILGRYYGLRCAPGTYQDTMYLHQATYPYLRKALEVLTSIYTWEPYYKDDGKVWDGRRISDTAEFTYNCRDCAVTREIFPLAEKDAKDLRTWGNYQRSISVAPSLLKMQIRGVRIDVEKKEELAVEFAKRSVQAQRTLNVLAEGTYNINSSAQITKLLYGLMDFEIQYNLKTRKPTTDKDAINRLLQKYPKKESREHQILQAISDFRKFDKLASTYTSLEVDKDGRIHTSYGWVSTFRLSSSESHFGGGGNLQNIPTRTEEGREIRKLFVPDEGNVFLACDLSQAEAREVAWLARDSRLIEAFLNPDNDVHWERAKQIFGIPDSVPYNPKALYKDKLTGESHTLKFYRNLGKTIVHAFNYKMGPRMLQTILIREGVFLAEGTCRQIITSAQQQNPLTVNWQRRVIEEIRSARTLVTPLGDKRIFRGRLNDNLFRSAIAFVPQSTVGRIVQLGIQAIHSTDSFYEPLLNNHDEVLGQCPPEKVRESMAMIKECIEISHVVEGKELIIPTEFKTGPSWGKLEEIKC